MFPIFHVFVPLMCYEVFLHYKAKFIRRVNRFPIIIGSILPDLLDKPLSMLFPAYFSGRGYFHAPLLWILLLGILWMISKRNPVYLGLGFGIFVHILLDIPAVPWFWPFVPIDMYQSEISKWFITLLTNPVVQITEICGGIGLLFLAYIHEVIFKPNWFNWRNLQKFLFENSSLFQIRLQKKI